MGQVIYGGAIGVNGSCSSIAPPARVLSPFRGGGIAYPIDPDSYADWSLYSW